jgi:hypothetical protein
MIIENQGFRLKKYIKIEISILTIQHRFQDSWVDEYIICQIFIFILGLFR